MSGTNGPGIRCWNISVRASRRPARESPTICGATACGSARIYRGRGQRRHPVQGGHRGLSEDFGDSQKLCSNLKASSQLISWSLLIPTRWGKETARVRLGHRRRCGIGTRRRTRSKAKVYPPGCSGVPISHIL